MALVEIQNGAKAVAIPVKEVNVRFDAVESLQLSGVSQQSVWKPLQCSCERFVYLTANIEHYPSVLHRYHVSVAP